MPLISIVVPCCNEQESLPIFLKELDSVVHTIAKMIPASPLRRSRVRLHRHASTGIRCAVVVGAALDSRDGEFWKKRS